MPTQWVASCAQWAAGEKVCHFSPPGPLKALAAALLATPLLAGTAAGLTSGGDVYLGASAAWLGTALVVGLGALVLDLRARAHGEKRCGAGARVLPVTAIDRGATRARDASDGCLATLGWCVLLFVPLLSGLAALGWCVLLFVRLLSGLSALGWCVSMFHAPAQRRLVCRRRSEPPE